MNHACIGVRWSGKSTLARWMADRAPLRVIFDPTPNRKNFPQRDRQSYVTTADGARDAIESLGAIDDRGDVIEEILVAPEFDSDLVFESTCVALADWQREYRDTIAAPGVAFLVDELWLSEDSEMSAGFDHLARCGDKDKLQLIVTAHNPQDIPPKLRAILNYWYIFQTVDDNALTVLRKRCGPDVALALPNLPPLTYLFFDERHRAAWEIRRQAFRWKPRD